MLCLGASPCPGYRATEQLQHWSFQPVAIFSFRRGKRGHTILSFPCWIDLYPNKRISRKETHKHTPHTYQQNLNPPPPPSSQFQRRIPSTQIWASLRISHPPPSMASRPPRLRRRSRRQPLPLPWLQSSRWSQCSHSAQALGPHRRCGRWCFLRQDRGWRSLRKTASPWGATFDLIGTDTCFFVWWSQFNQIT